MTPRGHFIGVMMCAHGASLVVMQQEPPHVPVRKDGVEPPRRRRGLRGRPLFAAALLLAVIVNANAAVRQYRAAVELRETGVSVHKRTALDAMGLPGAFPLLVVGTVANSLVAGWLAFGIANFVAYGAAGLLADMAVRRMRRPAA